MTPSKLQQQAIEAKLNFMLGAEEYDRLFPGFMCGDVDGAIVNIFVENENRAAEIEAKYSWHVAVIVEAILKRPVRLVNVLPKDFSDSKTR